MGLPKGRSARTPLFRARSSAQEQEAAVEKNASDFVSIGEGARLLDVSRPAMKRRIQREGLALWGDPSDLRRRLIRRSDLEAIARPRPLRGEEAPIPA